LFLNGREDGWEICIDGGVGSGDLSGGFGPIAQVEIETPRQARLVDNRTGQSAAEHAAEHLERHAIPLQSPSPSPE
jgi:hypothetical protein